MATANVQALTACVAVPTAPQQCQRRTAVCPCWYCELWALWFQLCFT